MEKLGQIEVVCGPMFAGKTEELIKIVSRLGYAHKKYLVFKPGIDDRYSTDSIVSHSAYSKKSINITEPDEILKYIDDSIEAVIIDEVQFLSKDIIRVCEWLADNDIRVICGGLDCDFRGIPFPVMSELMARAEKVTKLNAICTVCGRNASRTQRIINGHAAYEDDPIVLVGAKEAYEPRCRKCHVVLKREK